ncbi:MAG: hypothetical protein ACI9S8_000536 [Chlamydiales bacterium]|jgi:hypothetical protein
MSDLIPPSSIPPGGAPQGPEPVQPVPQQGNLGSHSFSPKSPPGASGLPEDMAHEVFASLESNDYQHANELLQQFKQFERNPAEFAKNLSELLRTTRIAITDRQASFASPKYKYLMAAIEKIEFSLIKKNKPRNPIHLMKGAKLLRLIIDSDEVNDEIINEIAITSLPESMIFVLESAWLTLFGEFRHIKLAGFTFARRPFQALLNTLNKNLTLSCLSLSGCRILTKGESRRMDDTEAKLVADACENCQELKRLHFTHHELKSDGVKSLSRLTKSLEAIDLSNNNIPDDSTKHLADALSEPGAVIRELSLEMNKISGEGAQYFSQSLKNNGRLKQLNLWGNHIGNDASLALAQALNLGNSTLERLVLGDNLIDSSGEEKLLAVRESRVSF